MRSVPPTELEQLRFELHRERQISAMWRRAFDRATEGATFPKQLLDDTMGGMNVILRKRFCQKLERALKEKGWTQADLARQLGMSSQAVGDYYHGRRCPSIELAERFALALDLEPSNLIDDLPLKILQASA